MLPIALLLSYIRTLKRLSIASACANILQVVGIGIVVEHLVREIVIGSNRPQSVQPVIENFKPFSSVALGFGALMFAFEGISVVLPIYTRMKRPEQMGGWGGIINIAYVFLLLLYFSVGLFGYLRYGNSSKGSITLNLPEEPLYDAVRGIFTVAVFLTYPLQFYVPNEIIWNWARNRFFNAEKASTNRIVTYEYICRTILVLVTFLLAITVPKLNLMMDLVGSISGTALSIILPPLIHIAAFWDDTSGGSKAFMIIVDVSLILIGIAASAGGSYFSFRGIVRSFSDPTDHHID